VPARPAPTASASPAAWRAQAEARQISARCDPKRRRETGRTASARSRSSCSARCAPSTPRMPLSYQWERGSATAAAPCKLTSQLTFSRRSLGRDLRASAELRSRRPVWTRVVATVGEFRSLAPGSRSGSGRAAPAGGRGRWLDDAEPANDRCGRRRAQRPAPAHPRLSRPSTGVGSTPQRGVPLRAGACQARA
jgi:hypothetical protein